MEREDLHEEVFDDRRPPGGRGLAPKIGD